MILPLFAMWLWINYSPSPGSSVNSDPLTEQSGASDLLGLATAAGREQDRGSHSLGPRLYLGYD